MRIESKIGNQTLILETGKIAKQAGGSVIVQYGETVVMMAATGADEERQGIDFFPLTVDYREKAYAAGKIPGGFFKREGRPTEREILTCRLIDRPIRPLFPDGYKKEVQVIGMALASDGEHDPDVLGGIAASAALGISDIPFDGPVSLVRVGRVEGEWVLFPTYAQLETSEVDLVVATSKYGVNMIESGAKEVSEELMLEALKVGLEAGEKINAIQEEFISKFGKPKRKYVTPELDSGLVAKVKELAGSQIDGLNDGDQAERSAKRSAIKDRVKEALVPDGDPEVVAQVSEILYQLEKKSVRDLILNQQKRTDGRTYGQLREVSCEVGVLPRTHGSALFTRGQTQSLAVTTLGTSTDEQLIESLVGDGYRHFMLHYNFPPFCVGEVRPIRGTSRRETGHGALAERALRGMLPEKEAFPYTIRLVSEIMESNGSSSMATVCSATLALMDAGVPISSPVSGVALGLVKEGDKFAVLSDIAGIEDHFGDMDFKVAGTAQGITALQMDLKLPGLSMNVLEAALQASNPARQEMLGHLVACLDHPRESISEYAPRITTIKINPDRIRDLIGPGGRVIRRLTETYQVNINVENDGTVMVASSNSVKAEEALAEIRELTEEVEVGRIYKGVVKRIMPFGAFCEVLPGKEGLVHVSQLSQSYVKNVEDVVKVGDEVTVKVIEIDEQNRVNLSIKEAQKAAEEQTAK
ncbi:MAG: polyribonucleotide nucleotidyltransferase [Candidatus Omnitrophica bacterium]|nr:polyribonucleotide nucleotidyltransferase [Candidatus Omnitrophota bacterium]